MKTTFLFLTFLFYVTIISGSVHVSNLKVDFQTAPLGFDNPIPLFSWQLVSEERGTFQTAFEVQVSDDLKKLDAGTGNIWQSGKVEKDACFGIVYSGKPLQSFTRYYWKVRIWDQSGTASNWSEISWFETSMMKPSDWKALWISDIRPLPQKDEDFYKEIPNPLLRKELILKKEIRSARLYISGLGYYVAFINGQRVGDHMLDPAWTQYSKEVMYSTYDVTGLLNKGYNAIGMMLGNGWFNPLPIRLFQSFNLREFLTTGKPCAKAQLRVVYHDGSVETFVTDNSWKTSDGPVLKNNVYIGETFDARLIRHGWDKPGFNDAKWSQAVSINGPAGKLTAQHIPPIRVTKVLKPIKMTEPKPGVYIFDFGQNFAGVPRLKVKGPAGTIVNLRGGEDIHADGTLNYHTVITGQLKAMWNLNGGPGCPKDPMNTITYILDGNGDKEYTPQFTFSGFRYIEVTGFPGKPDLNSVEGLRMNSDLQETGSFECSNPMFNKLQDVIKRTFLSNVFSIQSDCPAREKFGYGADIVVTSETFSYNFDMNCFYRKTVQDFANDARQNGGMPETAPYNGIADRGIGGQSGPLGWQLAFPYCLKHLYDFYGDKAIIEKNYEILKKQVNFIRSIYPNHIVPKDISDHASIDPKPESLTATAFYLQHVEILTEFARILGKIPDIEEYTKLAYNIRTTCTTKFLKPGTGIFDNGTQAAQLFAMYHKLSPDIEKEATFKHLAEEIFFKHNGHLSTGIFATKYLFDVSRIENRNDIAYTVANQRLASGYGYMLEHGATTLWESWSYPDTVESQNHPMFGSVGEWFYRSLLGINASLPGFKTFYVKPQPAGDLTWAKGHYDAIIGRIEIDWKIEGTHFYLNVVIPSNSLATVFVPSLKGKSPLEGGQPAASAKGLKFLDYKDGYSIYKAGSGNYSFDSVFQ